MVNDMMSSSQVSSTPPHDVHSSPFLKVGCSQSLGLLRKNNQDAILTITGRLGGDTNRPDFGLYVVADGMGGHKDGGRASELATQTVGRVVINHILGEPNKRDIHTPTKPSIEHVLEAALLQCHQDVTHQVPEGGTTLTAALILNHSVSLAHIGDSRAYLVKDDSSISQLTKDHSLVQRMIDEGQITDDQREIHPQRNVLYQAIGQGNNLDIDLHTHPMPPGTKLLLCSDGLWGMLGDSLLRQIINENQNVQPTCDRLVQEANYAGGTDNITALLIINGSEPIHE